MLDCPVRIEDGDAAIVAPLRAALTVRVALPEFVAPAPSVIFTLMECDPCEVDDTAHVELVDVHPEETVTPDGTVQV